MNTRYSTILLGAALLAASASAEAATKKIKLDVNELVAIAPSTFVLGLAITIPDGALNAVSVPFVLPADYKKNSQVKIKINYYAGQTGCNFALTPYLVFRARPGRAPTGGAVNTAGTGLVFSGSTIVAAPAVTGAVFSQTALLNKQTGSPMVDQKAGDMITVVFARDGSSVTDTCINAIATVGATIVYQTN